jgi:hypothetical protein
MNSVQLVKGEEREEEEFKAYRISSLHDVFVWVGYILYGKDAFVIIMHFTRLKK